MYSNTSTSPATKTSLTYIEKQGESPSPGRLLPTQEVLSTLKEKLLSVFDYDRILASQKLPVYCLQPDIVSLGPDRVSYGPLLGNDFHIIPSIDFEPSAWSACLQLENDGSSSGTGNVVVMPLCHHSVHDIVHQDGQDNDSDRTLDRLRIGAKVIHTLWPHGETGAQLEDQMSLQLSDARADKNHHVSDWICPGSLRNERLDARAVHATQSEGGSKFLQGQLVGSSTRSYRCQPTRKVAGPLSTAEIWSIAIREESMTLSFPAIATILCLMSNPSKVNTCSDVPSADRDVTWCLDGLHGLCRLKSPTEGERDLSYTLGTSPDCWMHLGFVYHHFTVEPFIEPPKPKGSGLRVERRSFSICLALGRTLTFTEARRWVSGRVATPYRGQQANLSPAAVILSISDAGHPVSKLKAQDWDQSGLQSQADTAGVVLYFQFLWGGMVHWEEQWMRCLDSIAGIFDVTVDDLSQHAVELLFHRQDAKRRLQCYGGAIQLLHFFRREIEVVRRSLGKMHKTWERTYVGQHSEVLDRFDGAVQCVLLDNWAKLLQHVDSIQGRLLQKIHDIEERVRDLRRFVSEATSMD